VCWLPYASDRTEGVPGAFVHAHTVRFVSLATTGQVRDSQSVHVLLPGQIHGLGRRRHESLATALSFEADALSCEPWRAAVVGTP
jgi:hypothetical protein